MEHIMKLLFVSVLSIFINSSFALNILYNMYLATPSSVKMYSTTLGECARKCYGTSDCGYVTFRRMTSLCEMFHGPVDQSDIKERQGSVVLDLASISAYCEKRGSFCGAPGIDMVDTTRFCTEMPPSNGDMEFLGNTNKFGDTRVGTCPPGQQLEGPDQITCSVDGAWTSAGTCQQVPAIAQQPSSSSGSISGTGGSLPGTSMPGAPQNCPPPETLPTVVHISYDIMSESGITIRDATTNTPITFSNGSTALFGCSPGTSMRGSNSSTCISGTWTAFPGCRRSTMRGVCSGDEDCVDQGSECRDSKCWCLIGLSWSYTTSSCDTSCAQYGTTFQVVKNAQLNAPSDKILDMLSVLTFEECTTRCLSTGHQPGVLCKSFNVINELGTSMCFLFAVTADSDSSNLVQYMRGALIPSVHHQRDCT